MRKTLLLLLFMVGIALAQPVSTAQVDEWQDAESFGGCSLACAVGWTTGASSELPASGSNSYGPGKAQDVDYATCWAEGASGDGIGEYLEFRLNSDESSEKAPLHGLRVKNGYAKSAGIWRKNNRIKEMDLSVNGQVKTRIRLLDTMESQGVGFESVSVGPGDVIRLTIVSVYPGTAYQDTCVSEVILSGAH